MPNRHATRHPAMAYALAADPDTNPNILHRLAKHREPLIRGLVARHERATDQTLLTLAHDRSPTVHRALLTRKRIPVHTITQLVKTYARKKYAVYFPEILANLAGHRCLRGQDLTTIYSTVQSFNSSTVRLALANNPQTPRTILTQLADHLTPPLAAALIKNRLTPGPLRLHLNLITHTAEA